ncbi:hypothetical protein [Bacillus cereus]|uniref:Uncharacterized protein n=1 Tax=Bacillus cereus VD196 TaxID=1053243 RepID=A0A9W5Q2Q6_BACCE|nr:hypothetical protein [Bacillus cereus]EOO65283.1 hypothetical protein IKE_03933 [Bacillus cereus VD196]HDR8070567.1 hypothetical protein [Bacillus cereus]
MKLFLLYVSYPYEGGYVYGVYFSREEAENTWITIYMILALITHISRSLLWMNTNGLKFNKSVI